MSSREPPDPPLGIVVTTFASNGYTRFLPGWASAIVAFMSPDTTVSVVVDHADEHVFAAREIFVSAGFAFHYAERGDRHPSQMRDEALVGAAAWVDHGEWVFFLDVDDLLTADVAEEIERYHLEADVILCGYRRTGTPEDLAASDPCPEKLHERFISDGQTRPPRSWTSPALIRKEVIIAVDIAARGRTPVTWGAWDTAFWLRVCRQPGVRFVGTARPVFDYVARSDSVYHQRRKRPHLREIVYRQMDDVWAGRWETINPLDSVAVVIPWRDVGCEYRERALEAVRHWWTEQGFHVYVTPDYPAGHTDGWRKGDAAQRAIELIPDEQGLILIVSDADVIPSSLEAVSQAIWAVESNEAAWAVPYRDLLRLDQGSTERAFISHTDSEVREATYATPPYVGFAGGGLFVVSRAVYEAAGGIPQDFAGWGGEDEAMRMAFDTLAGRHVRLDGHLLHFWHPDQPGRAREGEQYDANMARLSSYRSANGIPSAMWRVVHGAAYSRKARIRRKVLDGIRIKRCAKCAQRNVWCLKCRRGHCGCPDPRPCLKEVRGE